jgi:hypothetical protein
MHPRKAASLPRQICQLVLLLVIAVCCSPCHGQLNRIKPPYTIKPIKNTPLDPGTLVPPSKEATSSVGIVPVSPYIDEKGIVWSRGISNKPVGKANIKYFKNTPDAWWVSDYKDSNGAPKPRRAPQRYDRVETLGNTADDDDDASPKIDASSAQMSIRTRINPKTGQVTREVLRNGKVTSSKVIGKARSETDDSGQTIWVHGKTSVPAPASATPPAQLSSEQKIAVGILQILDAARRKQQQDQQDQGSEDQ